MNFTIILIVLAIDIVPYFAVPMHVRASHGWKRIIPFSGLYMWLKWRFGKHS